MFVPTKQFGRTKNFTHVSSLNVRSCLLNPARNISEKSTYEPKKIIHTSRTKILLTSWARPMKLLRAETFAPGYAAFLAGATEGGAKELPCFSLAPQKAAHRIPTRLGAPNGHSLHWFSGGRSKAFRIGPAHVSSTGLFVYSFGRSDNLLSVWKFS
jgi:hypothetical protein